MEELIKQLGDSGGVLLLIIPPLVQVLKRVPFITKMNTDGYPIYEILSLAIGIGGAFALGLPTPIFYGIVAGLASGKGYDIVKTKKMDK